jgi:hypothetical protein
MKMPKCSDCRYCKSYTDGQLIIPDVGAPKVKWIEKRCSCGYYRKFNLQGTDCKRFIPGQVTIFDVIGA